MSTVRLVNPMEFGIQLFGSEEETGVLRALKRRDLFRHAVEDSTCVDAESTLSSHLDGAHCILVTNGTAGLQAALTSVGVKRGDSVLVSAITFHATSNAVLRLGAEPVPIDFDPRTNLALEMLEKQLDELRPKAVIAVHWPGRCFHLAEAVRLCRLRNVPLIEDACQAFLARCGSVCAGLQGDIGVYSFQQNKLLTCGEGGCVVTRSQELSTLVTKFSDHGITRDVNGVPDSTVPISAYGDNIRMTGLHGAVLLAQLHKASRLLSILASNNEVVLKRTVGQISEWSELPTEHLGQVLTLLFPDDESARLATDQAAAEGVLIRPLWSKPYFAFYKRSFIGQTACRVASDILPRLRLVPLPPMLSHDQCILVSNVVSRICEELSVEHTGRKDLT